MNKFGVITFQKSWMDLGFGFGSWVMEERKRMRRIGKNGITMNSKEEES